MRSEQIDFPQQSRGLIYKPCVCTKYTPKCARASFHAKKKCNLNGERALLVANFRPCIRTSASG